MTMLFSPLDLTPEKQRERVQIRPLTQGDLPGLEWEGAYLHFRPMFEKTYRRVERGDAVVWVAALPRYLVGQVFVQLRSGRNTLVDGRLRAYIYAVRVRPTFRNLGIGSQLMQTAENDLLRRGYRYATLNVSRENPGALRFYERLGYRIVAEEDGHWSYTDHLGQTHLVHDPAWRMEKDLRREA